MSAFIKPIPVKLVLLGEAAVGKSSIVLRFVNDDFQEMKEPTIGAAFLTQRLNHGEYVIKYEIWDTAGQERFHSLAPMYYRNAQAAVVVYDITNAMSFERAKSWIKELQRQANANIVIALVGNKLDLVAPENPSHTENTEAQAAEPSSNSEKANIMPSARVISAEEAREFAQEEDLVFGETSAKTGQNVRHIFELIAKKLPLEAMVKKMTAGGNGASGNGSGARGGDSSNGPDSIRVGENNGRGKNSGCC